MKAEKELSAIGGEQTLFIQPTNHPLITHLSPTFGSHLDAIRKYAAMVVLMLFIGVGQMWGAHYIKSSFGGGSWETKQMTYESGTGSTEVFTYVAKWGNAGANHGSTSSCDEWVSSITGKQGSWTTSTIVQYKWTASTSTLSVEEFSSKFPTGAILYLKTSSNWREASAYFAAYFFNGSSDPVWKKMTRIDDTDYYYVAAPAGYSSVIFGRMNPTHSTPEWGDGHVWANSIDLAYHSDKNTLEVTNWNANDYWSSYVPTSTGSVTASSTSVSPSTAVTLTPSITSNTTYNEVKSVAYSVSPNSGFTIDGNTFTPTATGDYTITATITYNAKGFPSITNTVSPTVNVSCVTTPTLTMSSVSPTTLIEGNTVTINVARANSSAAISYEYKIGDGSWTSLTPASTSNNGQTATWAIPEAHGATRTFYFRATMSDGGTKTTAASDPVTVYGKKTIHVKNTNNWGTLYLYAWDSEGTLLNGEWPGTTGAGSNGLSCTKTGGQWWDVVITSQVSKFILNANVSGDANQTADLAYTTYTDDICLAIGTASGKKTLTNTAVTCPTVPTSVTTTATPTSATNVQMTLGGNIGTNGNDNITDYGFYWGTTDACGTKAQIATSNKTGAISKQLTGLTAGTTYYFKAYATNGQGTSYGNVQNYKLPYKVTVSTNTGCKSITNSGTNYTNSTIEVTATKTTGYTFSSWTTTKGTQTSTSSTSTTNTLVFTPSADNATIQPVYTENRTTVNLVASPVGKGTFTSGGEAVTSVSAGVATHPEVTAVPATGYRINTSATVWSTNNANITLSNNKANPVTVTGAGSSGTSTLTATFTPITYTVHFNANGGTGSMSNQTGIAYDSETTLTANAFTRTGYTFQGWATSAERANAGTVDRTDEAAHGNLSSTQGATVNLYAVWQAKSYTVTLDVDEEHKGDISTATTSLSVTYNAVTTTVLNRPTAAQGYGLYGYYTEANGGGTKLINADGTWIESVDGYTDADKKWIHDGGITLYAYYKKAEITALTFDNAVVAPGGSVGVTPTVEPDPTGTNSICWKLRYSSNGNLYDPQPTFSPASPAGISNKVTFTAPSTSGTYLVEAVLRTGNDCNGGTKLDSVVASFQVAGDHNVTVQYKCGDDVIAASTTVSGKPLEWTEVVAHEIFGYSFSGWTAGDGITLEAVTAARLAELKAADATVAGATKMKAIYDGKLTANYTQKNIIYFKNTLNWSDVYVNFYTGSYWNNPNGSGNENISNRNKHMTRIGETDVWYYDYGNISPSLYVSFTDAVQNGTGSGNQYFWLANPGVNVVYPINNNAANIHTDPKPNDNGFYAGTPMFVPLAGQTAVVLNNNGSGKANYFNNGYWTKYTPGTGYQLKVYDSETGGNLLKTIEFSSTDELMPMAATTDLEANKTYYYEIMREGDVYYGNDNDMSYSDHGQRTAWEVTWKSGGHRAGLTTTASGDYVFHLTYSAASNQYRLRIAVDYPIANNDYRVVYSDGVQTKALVSKIVTNNPSGRDTVSFFIRPKNASKLLKIQKATVADAGTITWNDYSTITSEITDAKCPQDSVYNICLTMDGSGAISVENVEAYTGNFYIRTDAANNKWDNYRAADHLMTYSEYSEKNSDFTHYFVAHVESGNNVKFVVANDYSPNISDTLEISDYRGGDGDHIETGGNIKANANVRFMWDRRKNAVYRAYLDEAKSEGSRFLVLRANNSTNLMDENGTPLTTAGGNNHGAPDNSIQFVDNENWIYETNVMVKPSAYVKLYGRFHDQDFYFKGESGDVFDGEDGDGDGIANAIQLMTGDGEAQKVRVIYDFKTDRLLAAWMPSGKIDDEHEINADVMFVREGQGDIAQLFFVDEDLDGKYGKITAIKSAYGVMRFNKWTLNNKDKDTQAVLGSPASIYERSLYFISFPFRVKLNDVFGFGTYGRHWAIQRYNGERRAAEGFWAESSGFWEWMDRNTEYLEPNQGYLLAIDLDLLGESASVWNNGVENIELYFPSYGDMPNITHENVTQTIPSHACEIDWSERPNGHGGTLGQEYNRTVIDSHWNVMSVPTYVNTSNVSFTNEDWITAGDGKHGPNFLYTWNMDDNTLTPTAGKGYHYHAMHAYMVQYHGNVTWSASSGSPYSSIVARRTYAEQPKKVNFCLEIQQNDKMLDRTYVQMSDDEEASANFIFGQDMGKEFNTRNANVYTIVEGYIPTAGNTLPMSEQTTVVPVGVKVNKASEYTFAMPEGTNGTGVVLVDTENGTRTNLALGDYTVTLGAGTTDGRFVLEISPVANTPTGIGNVQGDNVQSTNVRKVMVDGVLYIVKDGKAYDARGTRVK